MDVQKGPLVLRRLYMATLILVILLLLIFIGIGLTPQEPTTTSPHSSHHPQTTLVETPSFAQFPLPTFEKFKVVPTWRPVFKILTSLFLLMVILISIIGVYHVSIHQDEVVEPIKLIEPEVDTNTTPHTDIKWIALGLLYTLNIILTIWFCIHKRYTTITLESVFAVLVWIIFLQPLLAIIYGVIVNAMKLIRHRLYNKFTNPVLRSLLKTCFFILHILLVISGCTISFGVFGVYCVGDTDFALDIYEALWREKLSFYSR